MSVVSPILNFNPESLERDLKRGLRAIGLYLSDLHLKDLPPGSFSPIAGATVGAEGSRHDYISLAAGQGAYATFPRPQQWVDGNVRIDLHYEGDTNSAAGTVANGRGILTRWKAGDLLSGTGEAQMDNTQSLPIPTTAKTYALFSWPVYMPVLQDSTLLGLVISRPAGDTYAGLVRIVAVRLTYLPARITA